MEMPLSPPAAENLQAEAAPPDSSARPRWELIQQARLRLLEFASRHSHAELLKATLDEAETLSGSLAGFYHFVEPDQQTVTLQVWSTRTRRDFCQAQGEGQHYQVAEAGVWADCLRERRAVIHNDYAALPHRKGLPPGHAALVRELVVPVWRSGLIVALLGVGNKPEDYTQTDLEEVSLLADLSWDIAERRRAEEALQQSGRLYQSLVEQLPQALFRIDREGRLTYANARYGQLLGRPVAELLGRTVYDVFPRELAEEYQADNQRILETGEVLEKLRRYPGRAGQEILIQVLKSPLRDATGRIVGLQGLFWDVTERTRAAEELLAEQRRFRHLFENSPVATWLEDLSELGRWMQDLRAQGVTDLRAYLQSHPGQLSPALGLVRVLDLNPAAVAQNAAASKEDLLANLSRLFTEQTYDDLLAELDAVWQGRNCFEYESHSQRLDGKPLVVIVRMNIPRREEGGLDLSRVVVTGTDISERKEAEETRVLLEAQLRQAQKMEAVGQLAGGVAHDFNNILTVILGNAALLDSETVSGVSTRELAQEITTAAERAAKLTRQMLAFSRQQVMRMGRHNLNTVLENIQRMLTRALGEHIALHCAYVPDLPAIEADAGMMEQVIVNLAVNARDAMPKGGSLTLATSVEEVGPDQAQRHPEARAGRFVVLTVTDTGCGMDTATLAHVFEPFFTTKEVGKGTGLGLATAFGIVKQHNGWIEAASQLGAGTTFKIFLPIASASSEVSPAAPAPTIPPSSGGEIILLVEDDPALRNLTNLALRRAGYRVFQAGNGVEALKVWQDIQGQADLLLTDMVMPAGLNGVDLAKQLRLSAPGLKVIYSSGYSREMLDEFGGLPAGDLYLPKPYNPALLLHTVRRRLDAGIEVREDSGQ